MTPADPDRIDPPDLVPSGFMFWPDNFLDGTRHMSIEAVGVYLRLLLHQWKVGGLCICQHWLVDGGLCKSCDSMSRSMKTSRRLLRKLWPELAPKFPRNPDGLRRNARLEHERSKSMQRQQLARRGGVARAATATRTHGKFTSGG